MITSPVARVVRLLEPLQVGPMQLRNRMCMPAMHLNYTMGGEVSDQLVDFYAERARGGVALITVGGCGVEMAGGGPMLIGLHEDRFIPGMARLAAAIQEHGAVAVAQLYHAGRYAYTMFTGQPAVAPSAIPSKLTRETPRALELDEIPKVQAAFAEAARRAAEAGFDGVEVLGSAGYLISQFLSPITNQRDDEYGGSFENRARFGREVVEQVRARVGDSVGLVVRVAGSDFMPGSHGNEESAVASRIFQEAGADAVNVTGGWHETRVPQLSMGVPRGAYLYLARRIRQELTVPVMASNRIADPRQAEAALRDGVADLINLGRPLIADPELPLKVKAGQLNRVVHCVACNQGCFDHVFKGMPVACMVNPRAGQEARRKVEDAEQGKKVLVVGGGPAGMMAAATAAQRGHEVILLEKEMHLGGQLLLAGATQDRRELLTVVQDLEQRLADSGAEVRTGTEATAALIEAEAPDVVMVATGARPAEVVLPGSEGGNVTQAWDVLTGEALVGPRVVVVGGGPVAVDVARELSQRGTLDGETLRFLLVNEAETPESLRERCLRGTHQVTMVEMKAKAGEGIGKSTRWSMLQDLKRFAVEVFTETTVLGIGSDGVTVQDPEGERLIPADTVVLAMGSRPDDTLAEALSGRDGVVVVGDAKKPRHAFQAIHEGFLEAVKI